MKKNKNKKVSAHILDVCPLDGAFFVAVVVTLSWAFSPLMAVASLVIFSALVAKRWNNATIELRARRAQFALPRMSGAC